MDRSQTKLHPGQSDATPHLVRSEYQIRRIDSDVDRPLFFRPWKDRDREFWNGIHGNSTTRNRFHIHTSSGVEHSNGPKPYISVPIVESYRGGAEYMVLDCVLTRLARVPFS